MKKGVDCQVFEDQLDAFSHGTLPDEGMQQLRLHARACPDCAMQLRMHEHLAYPSLEELEAEVPEVLVSSMWPRVRAEIAGQQSRRRRELGARRLSAWLVPAAAAAAVLLLVGSAFLLREVQQLRVRESTLVRRIAEQEQWLEELQLRSTRGGLAGTADLMGSRTWQRMLARTQSVTVSELSVALAGVPKTTTVLDELEAEQLIRRIPFLRTSGWAEALTEIEIADGLQAGEALKLVRALGLAPERKISTSRILGLTTMWRSAGRS